METAVILEMEIERDRKTCVHLDLKVTGANRELAQWLLDHLQYSNPIVAGWLGCGRERIRLLRKWAGGGFKGTAFDGNNKPDGRIWADRLRGRGPLESLGNSEEGGDGETEEADVADPAEIEDNVIYTLARMNEHAKVFNKLFRLSAFDSEAEQRMAAALSRTILKLESIRATLTKRRRR